MAAKVIPMIILATTLFGWITVWLWNWLVPDLFGGKPIGFWRAVGLLALARILFGARGFSSGHGHHWRRRLRRRWDELTPEQREVFRAAMRREGWDDLDEPLHRCGGSTSRASSADHPAAPPSQPAPTPST